MDELLDLLYDTETHNRLLAILRRLPDAPKENDSLRSAIAVLQPQNIFDKGSLRTAKLVQQDMFNKTCSARGNKSLRAVFSFVTFR